MTDRLRFFKWRAVARRLATDPDLSSESIAAAIQLRICLDSLSLPHEDRLLLPKKNMPDDLYWLLLRAHSRKVNLQRPLTLLEMVDPANVQEPEWRVKALVVLFNNIASGARINTPVVQRAFRDAAANDPSAYVRAWALYLLDPVNNPRPSVSDLGEGEGNA